MCVKKNYSSEPLMPAKSVVELYNLFTSHDISVWLDGGWGVDALLCEQTRSHGDLDIVVQSADLSRMRELLEARGYKDNARDDTSAWNFVLADSMGLEIDVHVINIDERGSGIYGPPENGNMYPATSLTGTGIVQGQEVRCISAEDMVKFHTGYELDETDFKDVSALCEKFGITIPAEYDRFKEQG